ncbi:hypothetical protein PRIC2_010779 [Phytophthora ramorum]
MDIPAPVGRWRRVWKRFTRCWLQLSCIGCAEPIGDEETTPQEALSIEEILRQTAQKGYEDMVRMVVTNKLVPDIDCANENGWTALLYAASNDHTGIVKLLLDHGASLEARNYQGMQALHLAASQGFLGTVKVLVEAGADIASVGLDSLTPLLAASMNGHSSVAMFLVEWLVTKNEHGKARELLEAPRNEGWTLLNVAADSGDLDMVVFLTEHGAALNTKNDNGYSPLHSAVAKSHGDVVKHFLSIEADVDTLNTIGVTPPGTAARWGLAEMAELLLDAGADLHAVNHNWCTPLLTAVTHGHEEVVKLLLERGADLEDRTNEGWTPLLVAAERGYSALIKLLVGRGASINSEAHDGKTGLSVATRQGEVETCRILIKLLADRDELNIVNVPDIDGRTALHYAASKGSLELVELLVQHGAAVNAADYHGDTPTNLAIMECHVDIFDYLATHGAASFNDSNGIWTLAALQELYLRLFEHDDQRATSDPKWFIDPSTIQFESSAQPKSIIAESLVGSWLGAPVIILETWFMRHPDVLYNLSTEATELSVKLRVSFAKEVARWLPLNHPHVLKLYGACHRVQLLLVVERVTGGKMRAYLQNHPEKTWKILYEVALAVKYLHERGIVHGHICGDNIFVTEDGSAKLGGFGACSVFSGKEQETTVWEPEECLVGVESTTESDVYSLGMCVIEAVTGEAPYAQEQREQQDVRHLISNGVFAERSSKFGDREWHLVTRMSSFSVRQRLSIDDVVRELEELAADEARSLSPELYQRLPGGQDADVEEQLALGVSLTDNQLGGMELERQALARLCDLWQATPLAVRGLPESSMQRFCNTVAGLLNHLKRYSTNTSAVSTRYSERQRTGAMFSLHNEIDRLARQLGVDDSNSTENHKWRQNWYNIRVTRLKRFEATLTDTELEKLEQHQDHVEVLTCLYFELTRHRMSYTPIQPRIFHAACQRIKRLPDVKVEDWFLPPYEVDFDHLGAFNSGGYGSVHHGMWMNSRVVVKKVFAQDPEAFEREVGIWFQLFHPFVVQLFGACHLDGQQFFVCEDEVNGQLDRYLRRRDVSRRRVVWQRLHETAVALQYLHHQEVLHRDLKCNNILIGSDGKVKLADFGLSSVISEGEDTPRANGAVRWKAPELLRGEAASCASDMYGLAMCILEAVTDEYPWGNAVSDVQVRYFVLESKAIIRPAGFSDAQWGLVERMTSSDPTARLSLEQVVEMMREFAEHEASAAANEPNVPEQDEVEPPRVQAETSTANCNSTLSAVSSRAASCADSTSDDRYAPSY